MLITFYSKAHADISLVGKPAEKILELLDFGTKVPGAIKVEDVPQALSNLHKGISDYETRLEEKSEQISDIIGEDHENDEIKDPPVSLSKRAYPVIKLLEAAIRDGEYVSWK